MAPRLPKSVNYTRPHKELNDMMRQIYTFYKAKMFEDFTIKVQNGSNIEVITCHKAILAANSPFFQRIFSDKPRTNVLVLRNIKLETVQNVINFFYEKIIVLDKDNFLEVIILFKFLQVENVLDEGFMQIVKSFVDPSDHDLYREILEVWDLSESIIRNFNDHGENGKSLMDKIEEDLNELSMELSSLCLNLNYEDNNTLDEKTVETQKDLFKEHSAMDPNHRGENLVQKDIMTISKKALKSSLARIPKMMNLSKLSRSLINRIDPGIYRNHRGENLIHIYLMENISKGTTPNNEAFQTEKYSNNSKCAPKPSSECIPKLMVLSGESNFRRALIKEMKISTDLGKTWSVGDEMKFGRKNFGAVYSDGFIYIIGGLDSDNVVRRSCAKYNIKFKRWGKVVELPNYRMDMAVSYCQNRIYLTGGFKSGIEKKSMISLQCVCGNTGKEWNREKSMTYQRYGHMMCAINKDLYSLGGHSLVSCEKYELASKKWTQISSMNYQHFHGSACHDNRGCIYVVGGFHNEEIIGYLEMYDPSINNWSVLPNLPIPMHKLCMFSFKDKLYFFGGQYDDGRTKKSID